MSARGVVALPDAQRAPVAAGARLIDVSVPPEPEGVVLVLHGGGSRGARVPVHPRQLSVLRMSPLARGVAAGYGSRLAVLRLLNSWRGWDTHRSPADDVDWALAQIAQRLGPELPVVLIGHSLGGRAALLSAHQPQVRGVVALAPWVYPDDAVSGLGGTPIVIIHGDADRVARPDRSHQLAMRLARETPVTYVTVSGGSHAMLRRRDRFDRLAARCAAWMLLGETGDPLVDRIAAGAPELVV